MSRPASIVASPELLAPAGSWDCAKAAIENGADAIYFGLERFNARMRAENFTEADLPELMTWLHRRGVKGYVTLNTLVFPAELPEAESYLRTMIAAGVDAVIVQDVGICRLIRHLSPDFPIHASTQMTITSAAGVEFARELGAQLVVLARECSLQDIEKIRSQISNPLPLEVFVHGALCVAYSGQCLTSEALGGRSANRGECAQACRMPYELIADGQPVDLGDRSYLLSPQDLSGLPVMADLVRSGVSCLKIEGRLKTPEYVANVTRVYRQALARLSGQTPETPDESQRYQLEMAFSRGLDTGWFEGINNQRLVHARFGKKRGVYLGTVKEIRSKGIVLTSKAPIKPGDGVVFDQGHPDQREAGGRVYEVNALGADTLLSFGHRDIDLSRIRAGDRLWKTSDPALDKEIRQTYAEDQPQFHQPIALELHGQAGEPLIAVARDRQGHIAQASSAIPLVEARNQPLTSDRLQQQFARLGNTPFSLGSLQNHLQGKVMLPVKVLNQLRRELVEQLIAQREQPKAWQIHQSAQLSDLLPPVAPPQAALTLIPLVRNPAQLAAATATGLPAIYCEFENPARYREAVEWFRAHRPSSKQTIWVAPPRITKPRETYILDQVRRSRADGYLVRNFDQLKYFAGDRCIGDFSLNVANPLSAAYFHQLGLERLTASYDLNIDQLKDLLASVPPDWLEITIHQHMPLFHMEHCVFCAFLSDGKDFRDCGRPCEQHQVALRDRVGTEHVLMADAGCRNTLFNGVAQTAAEYVQRLIQAGARQFRVEFLQESPDQVQEILASYQSLLQGKISGTRLWQELRLQSQLGVTRGPLDHKQKSAAHP